MISQNNRTWQCIAIAFLKNSNKTHCKKICKDKIEFQNHKIEHNNHIGSIHKR
jgi:hypothetical protein